MKRCFFCVLIIFLIPTFGYGDGKKTANSAKALAQEAFHQAASHAFNRQSREAATEKLQTAWQINPGEPWIYLTESMMTLQEGYRIGTWYKAKTFMPGTADRAIEIANKAVSLDPNFSKGYSQLAWLYIIKEDYEKAGELLEIAYKQDKKSFQVWLYKGTLALVTGDTETAGRMFEEALRYATHSYEKDIIRGRKQDVAQIIGNTDEEERILLEQIETNPDSAYSYGNYANFLMRNGRYNEAVNYYEKTISIKPYRHALRRLEEARRMAQ